MQHGTRMEERERNERKYEHKKTRSNWWAIFYDDTIYSDQLARRINEKMEFKFNETESIYWEINAKAWATNNWLTKNREREIEFPLKFDLETIFFHRIWNEKISFLLNFEADLFGDYCGNFWWFFLLLQNFDDVFWFKNGFFKEWIELF